MLPVCAVRSGRAVGVGVGGVRAACLSRRGNVPRCPFASDPRAEPGPSRATAGDSAGMRRAAWGFAFAACPGEDVSRETIGAEAKKETGQVIVITWPACSLEPTSGFEPLTYALRVRCALMQMGSIDLREGLGSKY